MRKPLDVRTLRAAAFSIIRFARRSRGQGIGMHTCVGMRIAAMHLRDEARAISKKSKGAKK